MLQPNRPLRAGAVCLLASALILAPSSASAAAGAGTATALTSDANPATPGQPITLTATVNAAGAATGMITFSEFPSGPLAAAVLSGGAASITIPSLPTGLHLISAEYGGDGSFKPSAAQLTLRVGPPTGSITNAGSDRNPSAPDEPVTLSAGVATTTGFGIAAGFITFRDGQNVIGTVPLSSLASPQNGGAPGEHVSLTLPSLPAGRHLITASFDGDSNLLPSTSPVWIQFVGQPVPTTTTVSSTVNPGLSGRMTVLTAVVGTLVPTSRQPSGTVSFKDGTSLLGTVPLLAGAASLPLALGGTSDHFITAAYAGDRDFEASVSPALSQRVLPLGGGPQPTTATLQASSQRPLAGEPLTLAAAVAGSPGSGTPAGQLHFMDGPAVLATVSLDPSGHASLQLPGLAAGLHQLTAVYAGYAGFSSSSSAELQVTVVRTAVNLVLAASAGPSGTGSLVFTASVSPAAGVSRTPTGEVSFWDERGDLLGTAALDPGGVASLAITTLAAGSHVITGTYSGDAVHAGGSAALPQLVGDPVLPVQPN